MQLNLKKIDERIQKLQEIKRIAGDPELLAMLLEFISGEEEMREPVAQAVREPAPAARGESGAVRQADGNIAANVVKGSDSSGSGLWSRNRS